MTSFSESCSQFSRVYVTEAAGEFAATSRARARIELPFLEINDRDGVPAEHRNQSTIVVDVTRGNPFGYCPGSKGHLCCNYLTADLYIGCTLGCTYCIMQSYLNYSPIVVQVDTTATIDAIRNAAATTSAPMVRVGSGEVGDSLLFDPAFELSREIIEGVSDLPNVWFESKTKTNYVDHLLDIPNKGNAVIGFSLNPKVVGSAEEGIAAPVDERLSAAQACGEAGYHLAFHFDPMIRIDRWREEYGELFHQLRTTLSHLPADRVAWISLGTVRYVAALRDHMLGRPYIYDEFVPGKDGKYRYIQRLRREMYEFARDELRTMTTAPIYLCMESDAMWRSLFGEVPGKLESLRGIFRQTPLATPDGGRVT